MREGNHAIRSTGVYLERQRVARAKQVLLRDAATQHKAFGARIAGTDLNVAGRALFYSDIDVDLVRSRRNRRRIDGDRFEKTQAIDPVARQPDPIRIEPRTFVLPHFAPYHLVARAIVAGDVDAAHVDAPARVDDDRKCHLALFAIGLGVRIGGCECVTQRAHPIGDALGDGVHALGAEHFARLDIDQRLQLFFETE